MQKLDWRLGIACALLLCSAVSTQAAETVYKWVDENGTTHYGTRPPIGVQSTAITPKTGHSEPVNYQQSSGGDNTADAAQTGAEPEESKKDPERCAAAKRNAEILGRGGRVRETTEAGSFRFLDEEEKQRRLEAAQKAIDEAC